MLQGTWLGPYVNIILIDDLNTIVVSIRLIDDLHLTVIVDQLHSSRMQFATNQLSQWSHPNFMDINTKNTNEMLLGPIVKIPPPFSLKLML